MSSSFLFLIGLSFIYVLCRYVTNNNFYSIKNARGQGSMETTTPQLTDLTFYYPVLTMRPKPHIHTNSVTIAHYMFFTYRSINMEDGSNTRGLPNP